MQRSLISRDNPEAVEQQEEKSPEAKAAEVLDALQQVWDAFRFIGSHEGDLRDVGYTLRPKPGNSFTVWLTRHHYDRDVTDPSSTETLQHRVVADGEEFVADRAQIATYDITGKETPFICFSTRVDESTYWELELTKGLDEIDVEPFVVNPLYHAVED